MKLQKFTGDCLALCLGCVLAGVQQGAHAGVDTFYVPPPAANAAPSYESDYTASMHLSGSAQNTPEADARPGEYYFLKGAEAFRKHDYKFAIQMYEVAASWAFKPAEYNLGVIYSRGQGVAVDLPRAMAWMALAAERNDKHYVDARETVYAALSAEQFAQANEIWRDLKKSYGDEVALKRAKARWAQVKSGMTGSHVGSIGNLTVAGENPGSADPSYQKVMNEQVQKNLNSPPGEGGDHAKAMGLNTARSTVGSAAEVTGGNGIDGSIAYRQLRESDNPYDPKFERSGAIGIATVGAPTTIKGKGPKDAETQQPQPAEGEKQQ